MQNTGHIIIMERVLNVKDFIEKHFTEEISTSQITDVACYSYRNINRIYKAVYNESIGYTIQRLRIEEAAKKVLYTSKSITEIGYESGYSDLQAFNKAFKSLYNQSPRHFRKLREQKFEAFASGNSNKQPYMKLDFEIETFPPVRSVCLSCTNVYDTGRIETFWDELIEYALNHSLLSDETKFIGELLDDEEITPKQKCRYNCLISLSENQEIAPSGFFKIKTIPQQKYATFLYKGSYGDMEKIYQFIYAEWLFQNSYELEDKPVLEIYLNEKSKVPPNELLTKICIPIS